MLRIRAPLSIYRPIKSVLEGRWRKRSRSWLLKWSFLDLTGFLGDLVILVHNLAELAHPSHLALSMKWLIFNLALVIEAEERLT